MRALLAVSVAILSGCAAVGKSDFSCPGVPDGVSCKSTHELYQVTNGGRRADRGDQFADYARDPRTNSTRPAHAVEDQTSDPVVDNFVTPNLPDRPVPVRTPAVVMRIWVASWEDVETGSLITPGYIYTEVEPRRWVLGKPESAAQQQGRVIKPLEPSSPLSENSDF